MPEAQTETKEKSPKGLILVGHYHHSAKCDCGTATRVESYYKQLPQIMRPACQKPNKTETTFDTTPFISPLVTGCVGCGCTFITAPVPENMLCPTCIHPPDETYGPGA